MDVDVDVGVRDVRRVDERLVNQSQHQQQQQRRRRRVPTGTTTTRKDKTKETTMSRRSSASPSRGGRNRKGQGTNNRDKRRGAGAARDSGRQRVRGTFESPVGSPPGDGRNAVNSGFGARYRRARTARRTYAEAVEVTPVREARAGTSLAALPRELVARACSFMDLETVERLGMTCKAMREVTMEDALWRELYEKRWRWRPEQSWARGAKLPESFAETTLGTGALVRPDVHRGGRGWRKAFKERYKTRRLPFHPSKRVIAVECPKDGVVHAKTLQRVLNATTPGDVVTLGPGTYKGGLTIPRGIEILGVGNREEILIVSEEDPALRTATSHNRCAAGSVVTNVTFFRQSATKRSSLSIDGHQASVYVSAGSELRVDSCDVISAGEGVVATEMDSIAHVHACNIHSVLSSFISTAGGSLSASRITASTNANEEEVIGEAPSELGYDQLFAAVMALSGVVKITNNRIVNAYAHAVVLFDYAHGEIHDNLIANNFGAGISVGVSSSADISDTIIANNGSVGVAMCGRGTIRNSEVCDNAFNGIDVSQRYTTRDYFTAHSDDIDEEHDLEEEFSAFLLDLDSEEGEDFESEEIDVVIEGCQVRRNANDGICVSGGANVDVVDCTLSGNACNFAIDRGNVRWGRLWIGDAEFEENEHMWDERNVRVTGTHSTMQRLRAEHNREDQAMASTPRVKNRFIPDAHQVTFVL